MKTERFKAVTSGQTTIVVTAGAYVQNDVVGGLLVFTGLRGGKLRGITLTDAANQNAVQYALVLFDSAPTAIANNDPYAIADADLPKIVFEWALPQPAEALHPPGAFGGVRIFSNNCYFFDYGLDYPLWSQGGSIYGFLIVTSGTVPTYAATTDVTLSLLMEMGG